jgi:luciferase family oxidoreductase group 1
MPELWVLGSSFASAEYAAELGFAFCFAHFINPEPAERALQLYRERFQPSPILDAPRVSIGVSATVAETDEEAERLSWSRWAWRMMAQRGERGGIPSPEEAMAFPFTEPERDYIAYARSRSIFGSPHAVRDRLDELGLTCGVDEFVVVTITYDFASRLRSYELLAGVYELQRRPDVTMPEL